MKVNRGGRPAAAAQQEQQKARASCNQEVSQAKFPLHAGDDESCARVKTISNFCSIPPFIASEIVSIFGTGPSWDGGGDSLFHAHCT